MQCKWLSSTCRKINTRITTAPSSGMVNTEAVKVISKTVNGGYSNGNYGNWSPPTVKPKRRDVGGSGGGDSTSGGGRSALTIQFSDMGINCCT